MQHDSMGKVVVAHGFYTDKFQNEGGEMSSHGNYSLPSLPLKELVGVKIVCYYHYTQGNALQCNL